MEKIETAKIILEYLRLLFSVQFLLFIGFIFLIYRFPAEISSFLKRLISFKAGPMVVESQISQEGKDKTNKKKQDKNKSEFDHEMDKTIRELNNELEKALVKSKEKRSVLSEEFNKGIKEFEEFINGLKSRCELFEFSYLNLLLVLNTKRVLLWFNSQVSVTKEYYSLVFEPSIPPPIEREAIFNALLSNGLIIATQNGYKITDKGIKFLRFIGLLK